MTSGQRPRRRNVILGTCLITMVVSGLAALPIAFLATSFLPSAGWAIPAVFLIFAAAAAWVVRDRLRDEREAASRDETEVLPLADIAGHKPPTARRRPLASFAHRVAQRAKNTKEAAQ